METESGKTPFVHLHMHSEYSILDGLSGIDSMVERVKALGMPAAALTDHGVMYGNLAFYDACNKAGIKPLLGCEIYVAPRSMEQKEKGIDDKNYHLVLLAKNEKGYPGTSIRNASTKSSTAPTGPSSASTPKPSRPPNAAYA